MNLLEWPMSHVSNSTKMLVYFCTGNIYQSFNLKIQTMKLLADNWNTLIDLLPLAITKMWKVDLRFKYSEGEPKRYFKDQSRKLHNNTTRYVFIRPKEINVYINCKFAANSLMPNVFWLSLTWQEENRGPQEDLLCSAQWNYIQHCWDAFWEIFL